MPSFAVRCQATVAVWCALWIGAGCTADGSAGATEDGGAEATTGAMQEAGDAEAGTGDDGGAGGDGCGMDPSEIELTLEVNGQTRAFELHVPADYDPSQAYPLIFGLHGGGGTAAAFRGYAGLDQAVGSEAIVVYPEGLFEEGTTAQVWRLDPAGEDFVFFDALRSYLFDNLCVDKSRVFATGWSMGGYMANGLGCYRAGTFRAIASCSGGTPGPKPGLTPYPPCEGQLPALVIHGSEDTVIPISEGTTIRDRFATNNGCGSSTAAVEPSPCVAYDGCEQPTHWCEFSGGHEWPDFVTDAVWDFFRAQ